MKLFLCHKYCLRERCTNGRRKENKLRKGVLFFITTSVKELCLTRGDEGKKKIA